MNVLITNARGMNNIEKQRERRELIKKNKASIVGKKYMKPEVLEGT